MAKSLIYIMLGFIITITSTALLAHTDYQGFIVLIGILYIILGIYSVKRIPWF